MEQPSNSFFTISSIPLVVDATTAAPDDIISDNVKGMPSLSEGRAKTVALLRTLAISRLLGPVIVTRAIQHSHEIAFNRGSGQIPATAEAIA